MIIILIVIAVAVDIATAQISGAARDSKVSCSLEVDGKWARIFLQRVKLYTDPKECGGRKSRKEKVSDMSHSDVT